MPLTECDPRVKWLLKLNLKCCSNLINNAVSLVSNMIPDTYSCFFLVYCILAFMHDLSLCRCTPLSRKMNIGFECSSARFAFNKAFKFLFPAAFVWMAIYLNLFFYESHTHRTSPCTLDTCYYFQLCWGDTVSSTCKTISSLNLERFFIDGIGNNSADRKRHKWTPKNF